MKYWFDMEFIEDGKTIDLISVGIVSEDGRELYLQSDEFDLRKASLWVQNNVYPFLDGMRNLPGFGWAKELELGRWHDRADIAIAIQGFCDPEKYGKPEFWAYYADYDWVALCQLFGTMMDLPKGWPMYCRDIKQWCDSLGNPRLPEQSSTEHHALADARWNKTAYEFLEFRAPGEPMTEKVEPNAPKTPLNRG